MRVSIVMLRATLFVVILLLPRLLNACSCVSLLTACDRGWSAGETIFLGKTTSLEKVTRSAGGMPVAYAVHFTVEESYRGAGAPGSEMVVDTGMGGGDCGYPFVPGTRYLVYASPSGGRLYSGVCGNTQPAIMAGGLLRELRAMRDHKPLDAIFGTIGMAPRGTGWEDLTETQPLDGVPVRAQSRNGASFSTQTGSGGAYAFASLPAGTYTVQPDLPSGFGRIPELLTAEVGAAGDGCRLDRFARPDGRITGTVEDTAGKGVAGFITLQPADPVEAAAARRHGGLSGDDVGPDGKFSLPQLPPGRYLLVFHPDSGRGIDFRTTLYWPATSGDAIELGFGQHLDGVVFRTGK